MVGILCEKRKKIAYCKNLYQILNRDPFCPAGDMIVFSVFDIDFGSNAVRGNLVTQSGIKPITAQIPGVINNFLSPQKRKTKKRLRLLAGQPGIMLKNEANRFDQHIMMQMLSSSAKTSHLVPHNLRENEGSVSFTLYAARDAAGNWHVLPSAEHALTQSLYKPALDIAKCINSFIPSLAFCTVKLAPNQNRVPVLACFSGWDSSLLLKKQKPVESTGETGRNMVNWTHGKHRKPVKTHASGDEKRCIYPMTAKCTYLITRWRTISSLILITAG